MKPAGAASVLLVSLQLLLLGTGSSEPSSPKKSVKMCEFLSELNHVEDLTPEMMILLDSLFKAFSNCSEAAPGVDNTKGQEEEKPPKSGEGSEAAPGVDNTKGQEEEKPPESGNGEQIQTTTETSTHTTPRSTVTALSTTITTSRQDTPGPAPRSLEGAATFSTSVRPGSEATPRADNTEQHGGKKPAKSETEISSQRAGSETAPRVGNTEWQGGERSPKPGEETGNEEQQGGKKPDRTILWILLGALGALMLVTILVLKSKVLTCTKVHTYTDVAEYSEEKLYNKNDEIVLLGVTSSGPGGEDNQSYSPRGSIRYEEFSPDSTY